MKLNIYKKNTKLGFTLAEVLITLTILGIVAAITVPNLVRRQILHSNKQKVKKSMAAYDAAFNNMIISNNFKSNQEIVKWANIDVSDCSNTINYFKPVQKINDCRFKTADKVWWDITNIENPVIFLHDKYKEFGYSDLLNLAKTDLETNWEVFAFVGRMEDNIGAVRINDNAFEQMQENNIDNKMYMTKLWGYLNNYKFENVENIMASDQLKMCKESNADSCRITVNGETITYNKITTQTTTSISHACIYFNTDKQQCKGYTSVASPDDYWVAGDMGTISSNEAKSTAVCEASADKNACYLNGDYNTAARLKCETFGGHLASLAEIKVAFNKGDIGSGYYWADEKYCRKGACYLDNSGKFHGDVDGDSTFQMLCIGDK